MAPPPYQTPAGAPPSYTTPAATTIPPSYTTTAPSTIPVAAPAANTLAPAVDVRSFCNANDIIIIRTVIIAIQIQMFTCLS